MVNKAIAIVVVTQLTLGVSLLSMAAGASANDSLAPTEVVVGSGGYESINDAMAVVADGGTVIIEGGEYSLPITVINKSITLKAREGETVLIKASQDTTNIGDTRNWITISDSCTVIIEGIDFDGNSLNIYTAIAAQGKTTLKNCTVSNINYYTNSGRAVVVTTGDCLLEGNKFTNIRDAGVYFYECCGGEVTSNTFSGNGGVSYRQYGIWVTSSSEVLIKDNTIRLYGGKPTAGISSAGIMVDNSAGQASNVYISGNLIEENYCGIAVGNNSNETSNVTANGNRLLRNTSSSIYSFSEAVDARYNYWGSGGPSLREGNKITSNVEVYPWAVDNTDLNGDGKFDNLVLPIELSWTDGSRKPRVENVDSEAEWNLNFKAKSVLQAPEQNVAIVTEWSKDNGLNSGDLVVEGKSLMGSKYTVNLGLLGQQEVNKSLTVKFETPGRYQVKIYAVESFL